MLRKITPSNISPWQGTRTDGSPYTVEQVAAMKAQRPNWTTFVDRPVTLEAARSGLWEPIPAPIVVLCPIIAWTKDRLRVLVITPAGFTQWLNAPPGYASR